MPKNFNKINEYENGFQVEKLFIERVSGVETVRDTITIHFNNKTLNEVLTDFINLEKQYIENKYNTIDARDWKINKAKEDVILNIKNNFCFQNINYRPFDYRKTFYTGKQNGFICNGRFNVMKHLLKPNIAIILPRLCKGIHGFEHGFVSKFIVDRAFGDAFSGAGTNVFPLYLYLDNPTDIDQVGKRVPNLDEAIVEKIAKTLGLTFMAETTQNSPPYHHKNNIFTPIDILDYIYAVLHAPTYRTQYQEFLKIDFPRVPYPKEKNPSGNWWNLVEY